MKSNSVLILSGYNQRAVISFCRFAKENAIEIHIAANSSDDPILLSEYGEQVIEIREKASLSTEDFARWRTLIQEDNVVILPSTEYLNRFLLTNRDELEKQAYTVPLCDEKIYNEVSDKYSFSRLCEEHGIDVPDEFTDEPEFPCVAKPKSYFSPDNKTLRPVIINTSEQYKAFLDGNNSEDFYFQNFIGGRSIYFLYYFTTDGKVSHYNQENLIQQDQGLSIIAAKSSGYTFSEASDKFISMFLNLGFHGLVMVESKFHNEKHFAIEANPRLWGPSQLILDAKMDLFERFACDYGLIRSCEVNDSYKDNTPYFWSGGLFLDSKNRADVVFHGDYNEKKFIKEYELFYSSDIYLRDDTIKVFQSEYR